MTSYAPPWSVNLSCSSSCWPCGTCSVGVHCYSQCSSWWDPPIHPAWPQALWDKEADTRCPAVRLTHRSLWKCVWFRRQFQMFFSTYRPPPSSLGTPKKKQMKTPVAPDDPTPGHSFHGLTWIAPATGASGWGMRPTGGLRLYLYLWIYMFGPLILNRRARRDFHRGNDRSREKLPFNGKICRSSLQHMK